MSTLHNRLETDVRLSVVVDAAANLAAQISELNELREMVQKSGAIDPSPAAENRKGRPGVKRAARQLRGGRRAGSTTEPAAQNGVET
jgi:hypothetical protein